jgi:hypothetical protein
VNDDREPGCCREFHLLEKNLLLYVAWRVIVEIVQTDLAPPHDLGTPREGDELVKISLRRQRRLVRMDADRGIDPVVLFSQFDRAIERARAGTIAVADGQHGRDPGIVRANEDRRAIVIEAFVFRMAV